MKKYLSALLSFSRKERNGMLVLFFLLLLLLAAQLLTDSFLPHPQVDFTIFQRHAAKIETAGSFKTDSLAGGKESGFAMPVRRSERRAGTSSSPAPGLREVITPRADPGAVNRRETPTPSLPAAPTPRANSPASIPPRATSHAAALFHFDPNTVTKTELLELGMRPKVAGILLNYRAAGGRFRKREDLGKIYGLREEVYLKLLPFVRIGETAAPVGGNEQIDKNTRTGEQKLPAKRNPPGKQLPPDQRQASREGKPSRSPCTVVEINSADSAAFLPLRGIGPVLSSRIVRYRQRLGGFHSVAQLLEVYGMDTASFYGFRNCLRVDSSRIERINLNEAGYDELRRLPYWSPAQIRVVLNYRKQHGLFPGTSTLFNIRALDAQTIQKVMPYLSTE